MLEIISILLNILGLYLLWRCLHVLEDLNLWNDRAAEIEKLLKGIKEIDYDK